MVQVEYLTNHLEERKSSGNKKSYFESSSTTSGLGIEGHAEVLQVE